MKHLKKTILGVTLLTASGLAAADVNIGVILSLTGPAASLGIPERNAVTLWPKEIGGHKVNVTVIDDTSDTTAATLAARKLTQENKVDVLIGPSLTPTSLAVLQVAGETQTPMVSMAGGGAIVAPQEGARKWAFKLPPSEEIQLSLIFDRMKKNKEKTLGIVGINNAYAQTFIDVVQRIAPANGVQVGGIERYNATDASFVSQALKLTASRPDAIFIVAQGTPAAMPQIELARRGYKGTIYQTQAIAGNDFLRVGGKEVEGTLLPASPLLVAEQLPANNPVKPVALNHTKVFEEKFGAGSRSLFSGTGWDAYLVVDNALARVPKNLKPGTPEFRSALRDALESSKNVVLTHGVYNMSPTDHNGADIRSVVMMKIENGKWRYVD
ncbi:MAG: ABC transporter substrate-binding protein [Pseudomonadota bacterium]